MLLIAALASQVALGPLATKHAGFGPAAADRFYRSWLMVERVQAGVSIKDPAQLSGDRYRRNSYTSWGRRGPVDDLGHRASPAPRVNATVRPMRVDFFNTEMAGKGRKPALHVLPAIFKFEGDMLVIASAGNWVEEGDLPKGVDYPGRPKDFESTKDNGVTATVSKPCNDYDQD